MGAFEKRKDILIPNDEQPEEARAFRKKWGWDAHEQIIIRGVFTAEDQEEMENVSSHLIRKGKKRDLEIKTGSARVKLLERMIVSWTLTENGRPVPVTSEAIRRLPATYRKPILEACDEIALTMDEEEQEDFLPSANGHSQGS